MFAELYAFLAAFTVDDCETAGMKKDIVCVNVLHKVSPVVTERIMEAWLHIVILQYIEVSDTHCDISLDVLPIRVEKLISF